jgi:Flp pilus assembly protein TadG
MLKLLAAYLRARLGNVMISVALVIPGLVIGAGSCIDLVGYASARTQLQAAVDAASLAGIAQKSPAYAYATQMISDGPIPPGVTQSTAAFAANSQDFSSLSNVSTTYSVQKQGFNITSVTTSWGFPP